MTARRPLSPSPWSNRDGCDDVIVGADGYGHGEVREGVAVAQYGEGRLIRA